ncbi:MAG TPA: OmpA family protein [Myxococcota bacterium]|nr:OmpA family protein [Myxococcota bacterium]
MRRASWLACAALVATACVAPGRYNAEVARQRALASDLVSCKRGMLDASKGREKLLLEKSALDAERAELLKQIESERAGLGALREALEAERTARAIKEDEIARMSGTYNGLVESLKAELKSGQVEIEELRGRLQVRAVDQILFDSGSAEIKPEGRKVLTKVATGIKAVTDREIHVEGYTDDVPIHTARFASNWDLSVARAVTVAKFLAAAGVSEKQLAATGYGEHRPIASNADAAGRQRNRRIEIVLEPLRAE